MQTTHGKVPSPDYYNVGNIFSLAVIRAKVNALATDATDKGLWTPYLCGIYFNLLKYALRLPFKGQLVKDLHKIDAYNAILQEAAKAHSKEDKK